jgi:hypothetical protein
MSDDLDALKAEIDRLTYSLSDAQMKIATLMKALEAIANTPWVESPTSIARAALAKAKQP